MKRRDWPFRRTPGPGALGSSEKEIREELELYLELRTEELMRDEGLSPEEARREAERRFGDAKEIEKRLRREARRDSGPWTGRGMMGGFRQDVAFALRSFRKNPGFTLVAVLTLGLALAGNSVIFSVLDEAVLQALPFPDHERLVFIRGYHDTGGERGYRMASIPEFQDWRDGARSIQPMVPVSGVDLTLSGEGSSERVTTEVVGDGYFQLLGGEAALGRTFTTEEMALIPDAHPLVVLSHGLWERAFGSDPGVLGEVVLLADIPFSVVGVMPLDFRGVGDGVDAWLPFGMLSVAFGGGAFQSRGSRFLPVIGKLAPGVTVEGAQAELDGIARQLQEIHPDSHEDRWAEVQTFRDGYLGTTGRLLWILFAAGALLLAIAAANVANLLLVRAHGRTRELTVRRALGADSGRLVGQILTESVVLAVLGGALGLLLANWGLSALVPAIPEGVLPGYVEPSISLRVFLFTLAILVGVGVLSGLAPAVASARDDLAGVLRSGGRGEAGGRNRVQQAFVVTQVGLAILLLVGAGLLTRSLRAQLQVDPGIEMEGIHVFRVSPPRERYPDPDALRPYTEEIIRRVAAIPGVTWASASSDFPFRGRTSGSFIVRPDDPENLIRYHRHSVSPGYLENLGARLIAGRTLTTADDASAPGVTVVTETMVRRVFPELDDPASAVGERVFIGNPNDPDNGAEIVGVIEDVRYRNLTQDMMAEPNSPDLFFSIQQIPALTQEISFHTTREVSQVLPAIRETVRELDPSTPLYAPAALRDAYLAQTATPRMAALLMGLFSALALALACVGIYGILAFTVGEREREIAVRRALGAQARTVAGSVVWSGVQLAGLGLVLGVGGAVFGSRLLESFLFQVEAGDPATYLGVGGLMLAVILAAAAIPAWRATRKDPVEALTGE